MKSTSGSLGSTEIHLISQQHEICIPSASPTHLPQSPSLNLPRADLLYESRREDYLKICAPLYKASIKGDWEAAKGILEEHRELVRFSINKNCETPLHVATSGRNTLFVENLMSLMESKDLTLQNISSNTAFYTAAVTGIVKIAEILMSKNKDLLDIPGSKGMMPLHMAALLANHDMVKFLYQNSQRMDGHAWTQESRGSALLACVEAEYFDVALQIVKDHPELAISGGSVLRVLAQKTHAFRNESNLFEKWIPQFYRRADKTEQAKELLGCIWKNIVKLPTTKINDIIRGPADHFKTHEEPTSGDLTASIAEMATDESKNYSSRLLFVAVKVGNAEFVIELIRQYPELVHELNDEKQSIFHVAVSRRHWRVFQILSKTDFIKDSIVTLEDKNGNNLLHSAAILEESIENNQGQYTSNDILLMRRELKFFKAVEAIIPPSLRKKKNADGVTPHELFTNNHKCLVSKCEKWVKKILPQLMVVSTLIATISFAAAITFPGGYNQVTGDPMLRGKLDFSVFITWNGLSFLCSVASILMFLSILSSPITEWDFKILPLKLISSVLIFYISLVFLLLAFTINFQLLYQKKSQAIPILIFICAILVFFSLSDFVVLISFMRISGDHDNRLEENVF